MLKVKRGEIWLADLGQNEGSEQRGERPVLIIQNDVGNEYSPTVIVASLTDATKRWMPTHHHLDTKYGLKKCSVVLLEQIRTIDKSKLFKKVSVLPGAVMADIDHKIKISLGLVPAPKPKQVKRNA